MKIKETLLRDPSTSPLVNQGQARIGDDADAKNLAELQGELKTFVCEGQYADGLIRILTSFLKNRSSTSQKAAWVSGFFGSGKSHLLKMAAHLWVNTEFSDGSTARSLVPNLPDEIHELLRELDTAGKRSGGLLAAAGSLPSGTTEQVRATILGIVLRAVGLPSQFAPAKFCLWIHEKGWLEQIRAAVESTGKTWQSELNNLWVSDLIAKAILDCDAGFASSKADVRKQLRAQFTQPDGDISSEQFLTTFKAALRFWTGSDKLPCLILILDEVQQYIGDSGDRSTLVTEVAEAIAKQLDSQVMLVGAGQSALTDVRNLEKLMDRFPITVQLSDIDVETVTRKVLLQKKPDKVAALNDFLERNAGEVSRQLHDTKIRETSDDRETIVDDYPLLPIRRRLWEHLFRAIDLAGTKSQLRSQLRIVHDATSRQSNRDLGGVIPADYLYEALAGSMVDTGVLLRDLNDKILSLGKSKKPADVLAQRCAEMVFLISRLPREQGADIGVRANKEHIADLLIDNLTGDNGTFRNDVGIALERLAGDGVLMKLDGEYRLQTKEGQDWDQELQRKRTKLANDHVQTQNLRDTALYGAIDTVVRGVKILQGKAKESRQLVVSREQSPPAVTGEGIPVWIRDGWSASEKEFKNSAQAAGNDDPIVYVFIAKKDADDLQNALLDYEAAKQTVEAKGVPSTDAGREARRSMEGRRDVAKLKLYTIVGEIVGGSKVYQGGGSEVLKTPLVDRIRAAAEDALVRLYPRFKEADASGWDSAIKHARDGSENPFRPVGYSGKLEEHDVCKAVLAEIGAGKTGSDVRKRLKASPYGWPQDAIDASLIALHRAETVTARLNGVPIAAGALDQNKISKAEFRTETITVSVNDKLAVRGLCTKAGVKCEPNEEAARAPELVLRLIDLARSTGGQPPLPAPPSVTDLEDLQSLGGNQLVSEIAKRKDELQGRLQQWTKAADLAKVRLEGWLSVERLARCAASLPVAASALAQLEAIRNERLLLAATDPVAPVRHELVGVLRDALQAAHERVTDAFESGEATLADNAAWGQFDGAQQAGIRSDCQIAAPTPPKVSSEADVLAELEKKGVADRETEADAIPGRVHKAIERAAKLLEPEVRTVAVESATLKTGADVVAWADRQKKMLIEAVKDGPVLVN